MAREVPFGAGRLPVGDRGQAMRRRRCGALSGAGKADTVWLACSAGRSPLPRSLALLCLVLPALLLGMTGCASLGPGRLAAPLAAAIQDQDDPETVRAAAPAFLVLLDGLARESPDSPEILAAAALLHAAYASAFVDEPARAERLARRGLDHARRGLCRDAPAVCAAETAPFPEFQEALAEVDGARLGSLYAYGVAWAAALQAGGGLAHLADLPRVQAVMERVLALDEAHADGQAHFYLGVMMTLTPPALGGRPEQGRAHLERAWDLSGGRNLAARVELAGRYARLAFDRTLHDRLLREVLAADPHAPGFTLANVLAQARARTLLAGAPAYFGQ
jgi:hypothetical protein